MYKRQLPESPEKTEKLKKSLWGDLKFVQDISATRKELFDLLLKKSVGIELEENEIVLPSSNQVFLPLFKKVHEKFGKLTDKSLSKREQQIVSLLKKFYPSSRKRKDVDINIIYRADLQSQEFLKKICQKETKKSQKSIQRAFDDVQKSSCLLYTSPSPRD